MNALPDVPRVSPRWVGHGRTLSPRAAYVLMASVIGLALFASGTPSPLYGTYRALWGFSPVVLTLVHATYAIGVLASLLLAGPISDQAGRRTVLIFALAALMLSAVVFMAANSVSWLFAARAIQGVATGLALGAASAALLDLHPRIDNSQPTVSMSGPSDAPSIGSGRFSTTYTFGAGEPSVHRSFWFQIASLPMGDYPYAPAASGRITVVVGSHPKPLLPPRRVSKVKRSSSRSPQSAARFP